MDIFVSLILVYPAPTPSNEALMEGLRRAVAPYPHLAGRLAVDRSGRRSIHLNNDGVLVLDAEVPVDMASVVADCCFTATTEGLVPTPAFDHRCTEFSGEEDGCRSSSYSHPTCKIKNLTLRFTAQFVTELKARVGAPCSTFQCLLAHVWKKITAARRLKPDEFTQVRVAVDCRGRANHAVPPDFFGNMVLWAFPRLQVRDVLGWTYGGVVGAIRDAIGRVDAAYIQSFVDFGSLADVNREELAATAPTSGTMLCPDLEVDSSLGFRFHQIDLGHGPPSAFLMPDLPVEGLMTFVPSCSAKGGVDVHMAVAEGHVAALEHICYSLDERAKPKL
ncbi:unnamed protein product [Triticum turgidum subsp. durum]|uniref:Uncharacterized protein n=1 Tax=Triticum turgidum subsp. durum TaxID=4567 RepID=A0A9R0Y621_TRITD|nr:unnamed protein product [Triticum turgidum subsp. durum]